MPEQDLETTEGIVQALDDDFVAQVATQKLLDRAHLEASTKLSNRHRERRQFLYAALLHQKDKTAG